MYSAAGVSSLGRAICTETVRPGQSTILNHTQPLHTFPFPEKTHHVVGSGQVKSGAANKAGCPSGSPTP